MPGEKEQVLAGTNDAVDRQRCRVDRRGADMEQRREFLCGSLKPEQEKLLSDLTTEFFQSREPVADLLTAYIERHPEEFPT